ncbi:MAG: hypothetical protein ACK5KM_00260 [Hyphomicrobiaceae bacterium]
MKIRAVSLIALMMTGFLGAAATSAFSEARVVGGITPDRRPEGLPREERSGLTQKARQDALRGVVQPYPPSLKWLDDQGGWFTPFSHPGMTGPYDIRQWHRKSDG